MLKYIEKTYKLEVNHGYTKRKHLDVNAFTFKERALFETKADRSWRDCIKYNWQTLPEKTPVSEKENTYSKSRALYYEVTLVGNTADINPVRILKQEDCPNAEFEVIENYHILSEGEYTLKELIDKAPAYYVIRYLKERGIENLDIEKNNK